MKRLTLIIMAGLFMLGLTQCKKEQTNTNAEGKWVNITVKADGGDRHIVYPATGVVVYSDGDVIYVGNDGKYVGQLTYTNGVFSGDIYDPKDTDYLHFYFVGGKTPSVIPVTAQTNPTNPTTSFTVDISDQSSKLPVLSYGHSTQKYTTSSATYACTLENQCALVEFSLTNETMLAVTLDGMLTNASINFGTTPGITPVTGTTGPITLYPENTATKWAILLPKASETVTTANIGGASYDVTVPNVAANGYVHGNNLVEIENTPNVVFSVAADRTVQFAPGNLQYTRESTSVPWSNGTWSFMEHPYDMVEESGYDYCTSDYGNRTVISMFAWGANGLSGVDANTTSYSGYWTGNTNLTLNGDHPSDWGAAVNLGGHNDWRTLTIEEWVYLLQTRSSGSRVNSTNNARYTLATINTDGTGVNGLILFPDGVTISGGEATSWGTINDKSTWSASTKCTIAQWSALAAKGCVFLPAAGYRGDGSNTLDVNGVGSSGYYWSASPSASYSSQAMTLTIGGQFAPRDASKSRIYGYCVRLVRNVTNPN